MTPIEFLQRFHPQSPWIVTAISPEGKLSSFGFDPTKHDSTSSLENWISARLEYDNLYFTVNQPNRVIHSKAKKEDITAVRYLHVDVDPAANEDREVARNKILTALKEFTPTPTCIIDSGNGYQGFWRLDKPVVLKDDSALEEMEAYNRALQSQLGGDHCFNIDRIMRLPGTRNLPSETKKKLGRVEQPTKLISFEDKTYSLSMFKKLEAEPTAPSTQLAAVTVPEVVISGEVQDIDVATLEEDYGVPSWTPMVIVNGDDPETGRTYNSRSDLVYAVACQLVRSQVPHDVIYSLLLDPSYPKLSAHVFDQKNPKNYAIRQVKRAVKAATKDLIREEKAKAKEAKKQEIQNRQSERLKELEPQIEELNKEWFVVPVGNDVKVCRFEEGSVSYYKVSAFRDLYRNKPIMIVNDAGKQVPARLGDVWLDHPDRKEYPNGLFFDPTGTQKEGALNTFAGFGIEAKEGTSHESYLEHIFVVIANRNKQVYDYVINWIARMFQKPNTQSETALVMRSGEGAGKNFMVNVLRKLIGYRYTFDSSQMDQILGKFNISIHGKILVHANEAVYVSGACNAMMKSIITEGQLNYEAKGMTPIRGDNFAHLIISSNDKKLIDAGVTARRYVVLDPSSEKVGDSEWFDNIMFDLEEDGGFAHLMHFFMNHDISDFDVRKFPSTTGLYAQKEASFDSATLWWQDSLEESRVAAVSLDLDADKEREISFADMYKDYISYCERLNFNKDRKTSRGFAQFLKEMNGGNVNKRKSNGNTVYVLPSISELRSMFDSYVGQPVDWDMTPNEPGHAIPI